MDNKKNIAIVVGASGTLGTELINKYLDDNFLVYGISNKNNININHTKLIKDNYNLETEKEFNKLKLFLKNNVDEETKISLIYASGIYSKNKIEDFDEKILNIYLKIHVIGFIHLYLATLECLKKALVTNVILIGTNLLTRKNKESLYYVLSKGMQTQLVKSLAYEHGKYNILFNQISPGMFLSNMNKDTSKEKVVEFEKNIPIKRLCTKEEIAKFIVEFSKVNTCITGEEIIVDGGNTIGY